MIKRLTKFIEGKAYNNKILREFCQIYYTKLVDEEINLSNLKKGERVLIIGGGPLPITAILIAKKTRVKVDIIDNDPMAVELSGKLLKEEGLESQVRVFLAEGSKIDTSNYDLIHLALQVDKKSEVLANIEKTCKKDSRLIVRKPKKILSRFYSKEGNNNFQEVARIEKSPAITISSSSLLKQL